MNNQETEVSVRKGTVSIYPQIKVNEIAEIRNIDPGFAEKI